jgi:glycosyltransferase involved in cell wall biosynthesis
VTNFLSKNIEFSLVIATLQDDGELESCLASMVNLKGSSAFEVIVVDQNEDNHIANVIARLENKLEIVHIRVDFVGASRARNVGAQAARGNWLGFPDDDCLFFPNTLLEVERLASDQSLQVITGQTVDEFGAPNVLRWKTEKTFFDRWKMFGCLTEATLFIQRDIFIHVNGFDENFGPGATFPAAEGIDLMNRLFAAFGNVGACYSPRIQMRHPSKIPPWNRWAVGRFYDYARGDGALIAKSLQPHLLYWGGRTAFSATLQMLKLKGWRSAAFAARLAGLLQGFIFGFLTFHLKTLRR